MNTKLETRIKSECTAIDTESRYDDFLDSCYEDALEKAQEALPFLVGSGPASRLYAEMDPVGYRCGKNDWEDSESREQNWVEIDSDYYELKDCETVREELVSELEAEVNALRDEDGADPESTGYLEHGATRAELIALLEKEIAELNDEDFD